MLRAFRLAILVSTALWAGTPDVQGFHVGGASATGWTRLLQCLGLPEQPAAEARVQVLPEGAPQEWLSRLEGGAVLILEGDSELARQLGFRFTGKQINVRSVEDVQDPKLRIVWEEAAVAPVFTMPTGATVLSRDRRTGTPLVVGFAKGRGAVLWTALSPGAEGYERFPFLPQELVALGVKPPFESRRLWAFFDPAYRLHIDAEAVARHWRESGIAAVHVGAWNYMESRPWDDEYLQKVIAACHRHNILVYAWLELPHVSDNFWRRHPEWREKTATLRDAHVDWRLLMNLANPDCRRAVAGLIRDMIRRFDWDGVNLAEIYFDGIQGFKNKSEFTPLNQDVRREFKAAHGFDPIDLFHGTPDPQRLREFLDYRVDLLARLHEEWITEVEGLGVDLTITHVDDRFDTSMRDHIGADAARVLKLLDQREATFVIEDPATVWNLGPKRYAEIARRYVPLTHHPDHLGVDINIVQRDGHVHPTAKQVGAEAFELLHTASESFARVMFYSEYTVDSGDLPLLPAATAIVTRSEREGENLAIESPYGVGVRWEGPASLDGRPWPMRDGQRVWVPPGKHLLGPSAAAPPLSVLDFTGTVETATSLANGIELAYRSGARALASLDRKPARLTLDGHPAPLDMVGPLVVRLPRGSHTAVLTLE
jgi:hypothetical protein